MRRIRGSCRYGIMPFPEHGGSYPYASQNPEGNTSEHDSCVGVGVLVNGSFANGFSQNGNGFDAPGSNERWPNTTLRPPGRTGT